MKKVFIISSVLLLFALILWGIYFLAFREKSPDNIDLSEDGVATQSQDIGNKVLPAITAITDIAIIAADNATAGDRIRYITRSGDAFVATERGTNQEKIFSLDVSDVQDAEWSPQYDDVILRTNSSIETYNSTLSEKVSLKPTVDYAVWSDISGKILYKYFDESSKKRSLNISNARGADWKELTNLPYRRASFAQIPKSLYVALWEDGDAFVSTRLTTVNTLTPGEPELIYEGLYGADFLYAPNGKKILVSSTKNRGGSEISLSLMNDNGGQYTNLQIPTIVQKAVWSKDSKTIYYAQPSDIPSGSVMPNDYKASRFTTRDTFWELDTETGQKRRVIDLENITEKIDATNLFLSQTEDALFFINRVTGILHRLDLQN